MQEVFRSILVLTLILLKRKKFYVSTASLSYPVAHAPLIAPKYDLSFFNFLYKYGNLYCTNFAAHPESACIEDDILRMQGDAAERVVLIGGNHLMYGLL